MKKNITWEIARKYNLGLETKWLSYRHPPISTLKNVVVILCEPERYSAAGSKRTGSHKPWCRNKSLIRIWKQLSRLCWDFGIFCKAIYGYAHNKIIEKSESVNPIPICHKTGNPIDSSSAIFPTDSLVLKWSDVASSLSARTSKPTRRY